MKSVARETFKEIAGNRLTRSVADGMNESIEPAPLFRERFTNGSNLIVFGNVHRKHDIDAKLRGISLQAFCEALI